MNQVTTTVDNYIAAWTEKGAERRLAVIAESCATDVTYADPMMKGESRDGISALIEGVQKQFPTHILRRTGDIEQVDNRIRFTWDLSAPDGSILVAGTDFIVLSDDGQLRDITGFFDLAPKA